MSLKSIIKYNKKSIIALLIAILLVGGFWAGLIGFCTSKSTSEHTYIFNEQNLKEPQDGLTVTMDVSKEWTDITNHLATPCGAQYDFNILNSSSYQLKGYSVDLIMTQKMWIDSGWNGEFSTDENKVTFVAEEPVDVVPNGEQKPFGAVMYSEQRPELIGYTIRGYWNANIRDSKFYWPLIEITTLLIAILAFKIHSIYKQQSYLKKIRKDDEIIEQSMKTLTEFIDAKDAYTRDHSARVAEYAEEIGRRMGLDDDEIRNLFYITLMHDCGKISVPDEILKKEGALTPEEFAIIKTHTIRGAILLKKFSALPGIEDGAHYHHERYDGYGYPSGLEGEAIPLYARIICVADAYDAMSSNRCYRKALTKEKILSELTENSGKQFDPKFVAIMIQMIEDGFTEDVKKKYPIE